MKQVGVDAGPERRETLFVESVEITGTTEQENESTESDPVTADLHGYWFPHVNCPAHGGAGNPPRYQV